MPNFTINPTASSLVSSMFYSPADKFSNKIWCEGLRTNAHCKQTKERIYDKNRVIVLRLLLICLSSPFYNSLEECLKTFDPFVAYITSPLNKHAQLLFFSLFNFVINYNQKEMVYIYIYIILY